MRNATKRYARLSVDSKALGTCTRFDRESSSFEKARVVRDVCFDEGSDEVVGVVIAWLHVHGDADALLLAGRLEVLRQQLLLRVEIVRVSLVDQEVEIGAVVGLHELRRVVCCP
eukprot:COSAG02_NODE_481_length_21461_cov_43.885597_5_plen_114_part_00